MTNNLKERLQKHNNGGSLHTAKYIPWELNYFLAFNEKEKAAAFEQYLKTQAGRLFAQRRLW